MNSNEMINFAHKKLKINEKITFYSFKKNRENLKRSAAQVKLIVAFWRKRNGADGLENLWNEKCSHATIFNCIQMTVECVSEKNLNENCCFVRRSTWDRGTKNKYESETVCRSNENTCALAHTRFKRWSKRRSRRHAHCREIECICVLFVRRSLFFTSFACSKYFWRAINLENVVKQDLNNRWREDFQRIQIKQFSVYLFVRSKSVLSDNFFFVFSFFDLILDKEQKERFFYWRFGVRVFVWVWRMHELIFIRCSRNKKQMIRS